MKLLGGATTLDSFLKDYKANETRKEFSPMSGLITQTNLNFPNCYIMYPFSRDLRIDKEFIDYEKLRQNRLDEEQSLKKLQIKTVPPSGFNNYNYS